LKGKGNGGVMKCGRYERAILGGGQKTLGAIQTAIDNQKQERELKMQSEEKKAG